MKQKIFLTIAAYFLLLSFQKTKAQCPNSAPFTITDFGGGLYQFTSSTIPPSGNAFSYWNFGDGNSGYGSSVTHQYSFNGAYIVTHTAYDSLNTSWCGFSLQTVGVTNTNCNIDPEFTFNNFAGTNSFQFVDGSVDNSMGGSGIVSYYWNFGDGNSSTVQSPVHTYSVNGDYLVCLTVTNNLGCTDTICHTVNASNACSFEPIIVVSNPSFGVYIANYTWTGLYTPGSFLWTGPMGEQSTQPTPTFVVTPPGTYSICLELTDNNGCVAWACDTIVVANPNCNMTVAYSAAPVSGNSFNFTTTVSGGTGPYSYFWNFGDGNTQTTTQSVTIHQYSVPTVYTPCVTVTDANGCTAQYCQVVTVSGVNCSSLVATCFSQFNTVNSYQLISQATGGTAPYTYNWTINGGTPSVATGSQVSVTFTAPGTYQAICVVTDANGCNYTCVTTIVVQQSTCSLNYTAYNWSGSSYLYPNYTGNPTTLTVDWGDGTAPESYPLPISANTPTHNYPVTGTYNLCAWISGNGCSDTLCTSFFACNDTLDFTYTSIGNSYTFFIEDYNPSNIYYWQIGSSYFTATSDSVNFDFSFGGEQWVCLTQQGQCYDSICQTINITLQNADTISGYLWNDENGNGLWDTGETAITNGYVYLCAASNPQNCQWQYVDANGFYQFIVAPGTYTLTSSYWAQNTVQTYPYNPTTYTFTSTGGQNISGFNFGYQNQSVIICGVVYNDANGNGMQDSGENGVPNTYVKINGYWYYTNSNGQYSATLTSGTYNIIYNNAPTGYAVTEPSGANSYVVDATQIGQTYCGNDFGIYADPSLQNLCVDIIPYTTVTPGFPAWYYIKYCNYGAFAMNGTVTFHWDAGLISTGTGDFSVFPTTLDIANHTATWNFTNLQPGECKYIYVDLTASTSLVLGTNTVEFVMIDPLTGDAYPLNNMDTVHQVVVGSWDPNAKEVSPGVGPEGYVHPNTKLNYTIHFQNMGTAPAVNVIVIDTLSNLLDWNSFTMTGASHNYTVEFDQSNGVAIWYFNNIMLPDSGADYQGSMGFIKFSINQDANLTDGTIIENFGDIYFDFNEPVRTNTAISTINKNLSVEPLDVTELVSVFPNPVHDAAIFLNKSTNGGELHIVIRNVVGQVVENAVIQKSGAYRFNRNNLPSGIYMYEVIGADGKTATGKIMLD